MFRRWKQSLAVKDTSALCTRAGHHVSWWRLPCIMAAIIVCVQARFVSMCLCVMLFFGSFTAMFNIVGLQYSTLQPKLAFTIV